MSQPYENAAGRWEPQSDGSWRLYPRSSSAGSRGVLLPHDHDDRYLEPTDLVAGANVTLDGTSQPGKLVIASSAGTGTVDHGSLTGLSDDDHPNYLNQGRGDLRYSQLGHDHTFEGVGLPPGGDANHVLRKSTGADYDADWADISGASPGLATRYGFYKHYTTNQSYPRGSWQTIKIGTSNNAYSSPKNNPQLHQFQISLSSPNSNKPNWVQFQYNQVQENDKTGPSSPQMWFGSSQKMHWSHLFEHQGSTVQIQMFAEGSGTVVVQYIIVKYISFLKP